MREHVAITGIGCISSFGIGHQAFADAVLAGECGIQPIAAFDTSGCRSRMAATIRGFDPTAFIPPLKLRRVDEVGRVALACARLLFEDAGWAIGAQGSDRIGVALGTATAGVDSTVEYLHGLATHGPAGVPAILFSNTVANAPASLCAIEFGLRGPNVTFHQREASSLAALAYAVGAVRERRVAAMVTGGADRIEEVTFKAHDRFHALSPMRAGGEEVARPFDRRRNGFVLGEGGFTLLLESGSAAAGRGARVYGEILGVGATASRTTVNGWPTEPAGIARAMTLALADAARSPSQVGAVFACGNGSPTLDPIEAQAIGLVFGDRGVAVVSLKGAVGESGAAGAASIIAGLVAAARHLIPPTAGWAELDPACAVNLSDRTRSADSDLFIVNSVAGGGTNYSVVVHAGSGGPLR